jgi:hypothetical protein
MSQLHQTVLAIVIGVATVGAWAQTDAQVDALQKQHQAHVLATEQSSTASSGSTTAPMDSKMKAMAEMHQKMMAAKTPEEKNQLMAEHMKTMQEGMATMGMGSDGMTDMQGKKPMTGNMGKHRKTMEKRMEMMEMMMQMVMDRMPAQ